MIEIMRLIVTTDPRQIMTTDEGPYTLYVEEGGRVSSLVIDPDASGEIVVTL